MLKYYRYNSYFIDQSVFTHFYAETFFKMYSVIDLMTKSVTKYYKTLTLSMLSSLIVIFL